MPAFTKKLRLNHGADRPAIVSAAGSAIGGATDAVEINIQAVTMSKQECVDAIRKILDSIITGPWPIA